MMQNRAAAVVTAAFVLCAFGIPGGAAQSGRRSCESADYGTGSERDQNGICVCVCNDGWLEDGDGCCYEVPPPPPPEPCPEDPSRPDSGVVEEACLSDYTCPELYPEVIARVTARGGERFLQSDIDGTGW